MELLKHELYKIFSKKIVYITILFFLLVTIFQSSTKCSVKSPSGKKY